MLKKIRVRNEKHFPKVLFFFDTETKNIAPPGADYQRHAFYLGVCKKFVYSVNKYIEKETLQFKTLDLFWNFLFRKSLKNEQNWIFAHNMSFDAQIACLFDKIDAGELALKKSEKKVRDENGKKTRGNSTPPLILDGPPFALTGWSKDGKRLTFVDTLNYWRTSLKSLGKSVGLEKFEIELDNAADDELFIYCERDVDIIARSVTRYYEKLITLDLGAIELTLASQAKTTFFGKFCPENVLTYDNDETRKLERECYYGGQILNNFIGFISQETNIENDKLETSQPTAHLKLAGEIYELDVCSLYPSVMRKNKYPVCFLGTGFGSGGFFRDNLHQIGNFCANVKVENNRYYVPKRIGNEIHYPLGSFETFLSGPELEHYWKLGIVKSVGEWNFYDCREIFTDYVDYFFNMRKEFKLENDLVGSLLCKILLNSLYGKFAQNGRSWQKTDRENIYESTGIYTEIDADTGEAIKLRVIGDVVEIWGDIFEPQYSFPAISGWVTSFARLTMQKYRDICGEYNWFYQATDSLYTNVDGYLNLEKSSSIAKDEIGLLNVEGKNDSATFVCPNNYIFGDKVKLGSVKARAENLGDDLYLETKFDTLRDGWKRGFDGTIFIKTREKRLNKRFSRGKILDSGWVERNTI